MSLRLLNYRLNLPISILSFIEGGIKPVGRHQAVRALGLQCQNRGQQCLPREEGDAMIEPLLLGIVLGLVFVTLAGLFFDAYRQYRRGG